MAEVDSAPADTHLTLQSQPAFPFLDPSMASGSLTSGTKSEGSPDEVRPLDNLCFLRSAVP